MRTPRPKADRDETPTKSRHKDASEVHALVTRSAMQRYYSKRKSVNTAATGSRTPRTTKQSVRSYQMSKTMDRSLPMKPVVMRKTVDHEHIPSTQHVSNFSSRIACDAANPSSDPPSCIIAMDAVNPYYPSNPGSRRAIDIIEQLIGVSPTSPSDETSRRKVNLVQARPTTTPNVALTTLNEGWMGKRNAK